MSKSRKDRNRFNDLDDDEHFDKKDIIRGRDKKKQKKINSALHTKNLEELINLDEDEYDD